MSVVVSNIRSDDVAPPRVASVDAVRRRVWAWHFYAGLITLPVIVIASLTGATLIYRMEAGELIDHDLHFVSRDKTTVSGDSRPSLDDLAVAAVAAEGSGRAVEPASLGVLAIGGLAASPSTLHPRARLSACELSTGRETPPVANFQRKNLFQLTWPLLALMLLTLVTALIEGVMFSNYAESLNGAVSIANQILGVGYDLTTLFSVGTLVLVSQLLGRQDVAAARRIAGIGIRVNTLFSLLVAIVLWVGGPWFVAWVNTPAELVADALVYLRIIAVAIILNGFIVAATAVLRGFGHTLDILLLGLLGNLIYLPLLYASVFGRWGVPEMGVWGAGLATLVVCGGSVVQLIVLLRWRLKFDGRPREGLRSFAFSVREIFRLSFPSVGENLLYNLHQLLLLGLVAAMGAASVLTRSYVLTLTALLASITLVVSMGNEVLVGYDRGENDNDRARRRALRTAYVTGGVNVALAVLLFVFSDALIGLFTSRADVLAEARQVFLINVILQPFATVGLMLFNALRAVGDVNVPVLYTLAGTWLVGLPLAYVLITHAKLGVSGLWLSLIGAEGVKAALLYVRWQRMRWAKPRPDASLVSQPELSR